MTKLFTCILCPNGCEIAAEIEGSTLVSFQGNHCSKGGDYVRGETTNPTRNIASSVAVINGELPLVSVRLTKPIPKGKIFLVLREIKKQRVAAPVLLGQVIISNVLELDSDVIATKPIAAVTPN